MKCSHCEVDINLDDGFHTLLTEVSRSFPDGRAGKTFCSYGCVVHWLHGHSEDAFSEIQLLGSLT